MINAEKRTKIRENHLQRLIGISGICYKCKDEWPCDAIASLDSLEESEQLYASLRKEYLEMQAYAERAIRSTN